MTNPGMTLPLLAGGGQHTDQQHCDATDEHRRPDAHIGDAFEAFPPAQVNSGVAGGDP